MADLRWQGRSRECRCWSFICGYLRLSQGVQDLVDGGRSIFVCELQRSELRCGSLKKNDRLRATEIAGKWGTSNVRDGFCELDAAADELREG